MGANLDEDQTLRRLKMWCVEGPPAGNARRDHMSRNRAAVSSASELLSEQELEGQRIDRWDPVPRSY